MCSQPIGDQRARIAHYISLDMDIWQTGNQVNVHKLFTTGAVVRVSLKGLAEYHSTTHVMGRSVGYKLKACHSLPQSISVSRRVRHPPKVCKRLTQRPIRISSLKRV